MESQSVINFTGVDNTQRYKNSNWWENLTAAADVKALQDAIIEYPSGLRWQDKFGRTLLHVAACADAVSVIKLFTSLNFDLNAKDQRGNTALHEAVQHARLDALRALIDAGASTTLQNNSGYTPVFYAVVLNQLDVLSALLAHASVDVNWQDSNGDTALIRAVMRNNKQCTKLLIDNGAKHLPNHAGLFPHNVAAYSGAADALRVLCGDATKLLNVDIRRRINSGDAEGNLMLHAAVNSGSLDTVKVCLDFGACIDSQQEDQSTPLHFAAMRGELHIVQAMLAAQPSRARHALRLRDKNGMTALHMAVMFDSVDVAKFLLDYAGVGVGVGIATATANANANTAKGADSHVDTDADADIEIDAADNNDQTPLLLATSKRSRRCVALLLERGANYKHVDQNGRSILHLAVLNGSRLDDVAKEMRHVQIFSDLLNWKDFYGCTALHYATLEGQLGATEVLLGFGADIKNHSLDKATSLHLSSKYGRFYTCKKLLDSHSGSQTINMADANGWTALHHAASNGHVKVTQLLLERGAIMHRAYCGSSAFNLAAINGHLRVMQTLLHVNPHLLDMSSKVGLTAMHAAGLNGHADVVDFLLTEGAAIRLNNQGFSFFDLAIKAQHKDVCKAAMLHRRWREILSTRSAAYASALMGLVEEMPEVCLQVLERCTTTNGKAHDSADYAITYDFEFLEFDRSNQTSSRQKVTPINSEPGDQDSKSHDRIESDFHATGATPDTTSGGDQAEKHTLINDELFHEARKMRLPVVGHMVKFKRIELLTTPIITEYLQMKWNTVGKYQMIFMGSQHSILCCLLFSIVCQIPPYVQCYLQINRYCDEWNNATCAGNYLKTNNPECQTTSGILVQVGFIFALGILNFPIMLVQISGLKWRIIYAPAFWLIIIDTSCNFLFAIPILLSSEMVVAATYVWPILSILCMCEFSFWVLLFRTHNALGLYVVMLGEIMWTLLKCSAVFIFPLLGFAFAFNLLFQVPNETLEDYENFLGDSSFSTPILSIMRVTTMTNGELKYQETMIGALTNPALKKGLPFPAITSIFLVSFMLLIVVAMFNLIVGLAVGDTKVIIAMADFKRIAASVQFYQARESLQQSSSSSVCFAGNARPESLTVYPNKRRSRWLFWRSDAHTDNSASSQAKARALAAEAANRRRFQLHVTDWIFKQKRRQKLVAAALDRHTELIKLALDKLQVDWAAVVAHEDRRRSARTNFTKDFKSIMTSATADWQRLFTNNSQAIDGKLKT